MAFQAEGADGETLSQTDGPPFKKKVVPPFWGPHSLSFLQPMPCGSRENNNLAAVSALTT